MKFLLGSSQDAPPQIGVGLRRRAHNSSIMNQGTIGEAMITVADLLFWSRLISAGIF